MNIPCFKSFLTNTKTKKMQFSFILIKISEKKQNNKKMTCFDVQP